MGRYGHLRDAQAERPARRLWRLAVVAGALLLVTGCASMPGRGPDLPQKVVIGYDLNGERTLLLQPVERARLSSPFGMRRHPVLGQLLRHEGVDYAAPAGAPVRAAGDGMIVRAGQRGSYGHYVRIRHDADFETAYAHLSAYAPGVAHGVRVRQGEVIGYVGATGRATGPHLHYEVLVAGEPVDPFGIGPSFAQVVKGGVVSAWQAAWDGVSRLRQTVAGAGEPVATAVAALGADAPACAARC